MDASRRRRTARLLRAARVRKKVRGTDERPRLCVNRTNRYLYVQVVSDQSGRTLASASTLKGEAGCTKAAAVELGKEIAEKCKQISIQNVVFDRNGFKYHGRLRAMAESAREAGLAF